MSIVVLTEEEDKVYTYVKEYLKKKPIFLLEEIIEHLIYRFRSNENYNRRKITELIKSLIKKKIIFPGTKLVRDDILELPIRVQIFDYITAMPGTNINELINNIGVGNNQAVWHLKWLEKFEFVRCVNLQNQKAYFKKDFDPKYDEIFFYIRNTKVKKIIKFLKTQSAAVKPTEISNSLSIHYNTMKKYLNILIKFNLLLEIDEDHKKEYLLNPEMLSLVQNVVDNLK